jgi:hypothetical protein
MKKLALSILASFEGISPKAYWPCDSQIEHMEPETDTPNLKSEIRRITADESDYDIWDSWDLPPVDEETGEEKRDPDEVYDDLMEVTVSGVASFSEVMRYLSHIGAGYEDCETMGTLGGPLGIGVVPDFPFYTESNLVVASIRVTPVIIDTENDSVCTMTEATWNRIRAMFRRNKWDAYSMERMGSRDLEQQHIDKALGLVAA